MAVSQSAAIIFVTFFLCELGILVSPVNSESQRPDKKYHDIIEYIKFARFKKWSLNLAAKGKSAARHQADAGGALLQQFEQFMVEHGKSYSSLAEKMKRFEIFKQNLKLIKQFSANKDDYAEYGITPFSDLTWTEFSRSHFGLARLDRKPGRREHLNTRNASKTTSSTSKSPLNAKMPSKVKPSPVPSKSRGNPEVSEMKTGKNVVLNRDDINSKSRKIRRSGTRPLHRSNSNISTAPMPSRIERPLIDWRTHHAYPRVQNQNRFGTCGACWVFAPVAFMDIIYSTWTGDTTYFSKQQLLDCLPSINNDGCNGGPPNEALEYMLNVGLATEADYPYRGEKGTCQDDIKIAVKMKGIKRVEDSEEAIVDALARTPLVAVFHSPLESHFYKGGIANPATCSDNPDAASNHAAVIVGHGNGYWIMRNSWGELWGDLGHYLLKKGICGVGREVFTVNHP